MSTGTEHREAMVEHLSSQINAELAKPGERVVPKPGIYSVPYRVYETWDAANHTKLKWFNRSAAHALEQIKHPNEPTEALSQGSAAHVAVLEPERFEAEYAAGPQVDRRYKEGKQAWAAFEAENEGKTVLKVEDMELCRGVQKAVRERADTGGFLKARGQNEVSIVWVDPVTGVLCKARLDAMRDYLDWPSVGDLKTCESAMSWAFQRDVNRYHYHQQAAMYVDGCMALGEQELRFFWLAVEKKRPYAARLFEIDEASLDQGRQEYQRHLAQYRECQETGIWPGFPDGPEYVGLPSRALRGWGE